MLIFTGMLFSLSALSLPKYLTHSTSPILFLWSGLIFPELIIPQTWCGYTFLHYGVLLGWGWRAGSVGSASQPLGSWQTAQGMPAQAAGWLGDVFLHAAFCCVVLIAVMSTTYFCSLSSIRRTQLLLSESAVFFHQGQNTRCCKTVQSQLPSWLKKLGEDKKGLSHGHVLLLRPRGHCQGPGTVKVQLVTRCTSALLASPWWEDPAGPALGRFLSSFLRGTNAWEPQSDGQLWVDTNVSFSFGPRCFEFSKTSLLVWHEILS